MRHKLLKITFLVFTYCICSLAYADNVQTKFWFNDSIYDSNQKPEDFCASSKMANVDAPSTFSEMDIVKRNENSFTWLVKKKPNLKITDLTNRCFLAKLGDKRVVRGVSLSNYSERLLTGNVLTITNRNEYLELKLLVKEH